MIFGKHAINQATQALVDKLGLTSKVHLDTGDMRKLAYDDASFDCAVSCLAIHNVPSEQGRLQALQEIARVVKPNGQVLIIDFQYTSDYAQTLQTCGLSVVKVSSLIWRMFPPVRIVSARK